MYKTFIFDSYCFDTSNKTLSLKYSFDGKLFFEEKIMFLSDKVLNDRELLALDNIFKYIHIACGISYYKLFLSKNIEIKTFKLNKEQAEFFNNFYINGLGEFSYKNNITNLKEIVNFPYKDDIKNKYIEINLNRKIVVPVGGGKDSITTIEILKSFNKNINCCSVNTAKSIEDTIKIANVPFFQIKRILSPKLIDINKNLEEYKAYNGHVPITGILAFILCAGAIIYDYDTILISNERSANIGNVEFCGNLINHQWSKSFDFEKCVNSFFKKYLLRDFNYLSFLRPLYEYGIAKIFSKFTKYHNIFTSCNKAFKIENRLSTWCCNCDKCCFVFLILSNFLNKKQIVNIFGKNLFEEKEQLDGFKQLVGLKDFKPFECVGEIEESICAILNIDESFKDDFIIKTIVEELKAKNYDKDKLKEKYLSIDKIENTLLDENLYKMIKSFIELK